MPTKSLSNSDLYDHIIGSGATGYSWWVTVELNFDNSADAPENWEMRGTIGGSAEEGDTYRTYRINADLLRVVMIAIGTGRVPGIDYDSLTAQQCRLLDTYPDAVDFDAAMADTVLQVAADGAVIYG